MFQKDFLPIVCKIGTDLTEWRRRLAVDWKLAAGEPGPIAFSPNGFKMPDTSVAMPSSFVRSLEGNAVVIILDEKTARFLPQSSEADFFAILSCAEADVTRWEDCEIIWSHCRSIDSAAESINDLPWTTLSVEEAIQSLAGRRDWIAVDLLQCRFLAGPGACYFYQRVERLGSKPRDSVPLNLAPWWVFLRDSGPDQLLECRTDSPVRIHPHRSELWGGVWLEFFASEMAKCVRQGNVWWERTSQGMKVGKHDLSVDIHRRWLMTPRSEFGGCTPREDLHIAKSWISDLASNQRYRIDNGLSPVRLPEAFSGYETAPLGPNEVILYFEACRTLLVSGWMWILKHQDLENSLELEKKLLYAMREQLENWLHTAQEDGLSPAEIIRTERERVPLIAPEGGHNDSCDCPICDAMAAGKLGPSYIYFDGYHLEYEEDFAFSIHATKTEWEEDQMLFGGGADEFELEDELDEEDELEDELEEDLDPSSIDAHSDELAPVWSQSSLSDNPLPGRAGKLLGMAFHVAELGVELQSYNLHEESPIEVIRGLNMAHREYQRAMQSDEISADSRVIVANRFKSTLEKIASDYPRLISHAADLQSQIDSQLRASQSR